MEISKFGRPRSFLHFFRIPIMLKDKNIDVKEIEIWKNTIIPYAIYNLF